MPALGSQGGHLCFQELCKVRVSSVVALVCWLSVLAAVWLALLGVVAWGPALWGALLFWALLALGSSLVAGRYKT
jgi:hypothetical protein